MEVDGQTVPLGGLKQRAVLAMLLLRAGEVVPSDHLIEGLWGERPPATAAKALQVHVSQLRKTLEPDLLVTRPTGYLLDVEPGQLDVAVFERDVAAGLEACNGGRQEEAVATLRRALDLWRGPPLADVAFESFAQGEIARLQELRLVALEARLAAELELGLHAAVVGELEALVAANPVREELRSRLMLALYRSGRQAEALEVYREARATLVEELGIEPGHALRELHEAILRQDRELDLEPVGAVHAAAVEAPREGFVGRDAELGVLLDGLDDALAGRGRLFLVAGEPGIGKSRLADEVARRSAERGARVLWGRCWEAGGAPAYWPWVQALRGYVRDTDPARVRQELGTGAADVAQMLPELHDRFEDLAAEATQSSEGARFRLFDSTAAFLRAACDAQPLVLVFDDLQAADTSSLMLLRFLARELGPARIMLLAAYRDTEADTGDALRVALGELRREPIARLVRLTGLGRDEVAACIELVVGTPPSAELTAAIHAETEGNPLFVTELVRLLASEGRLDEAASTPWRASIPQGMREVISHRLRQLSPACKQLLSVAAVLGREFRLDALEALAEAPVDDVLDLLDEARAVRVVGDIPSSRERARFSHALIRDSLYEDLPRRERLLVHRRAAQALELIYARALEAHLAELAHHHLEAVPAGPAEAAIKYARRAGDHAATLLAYEEAARFYEMAVGALDRYAPGDEQRRCRLLLALGDVQARGGDSTAWQDTFAAAAQAASALGEHELLARAALGYGGRFVWFRAGSDRRLVPLLESALEVAGEDDPLRPRLLARLAGALRDQPVAERRAALTSEAVGLARRLGDTATLAWALEGTYSALSWPRDTGAWLAMAEELTRLAAETGDSEHAFTGRHHAWGAHMVRGAVRDADAELAAMAALAHDLRQPAQTWALTMTQASRAMFAGRFEEGEALIEDNVRLRAGGHGALGGVDETTFEYVHNLQTWALRRERGEPDGVREAIERYVAQYPTFFIFRCVLANLYAQLGLLAEARRELDGLAADGFDGLEVGTEWHFGANLLAEVCAETGDTARAAPLYEALAPYAGANVMAHPEFSLGSASRSLALLAATLSRPDAAAAHFEQALDVNARMGAAPWLAHTRHDYGLMLCREGERERGRAQLEQALADYRALEMVPWAQRCATDSSRCTSSCRASA